MGEKRAERRVEPLVSVVKMSHRLPRSFPVRLSELAAPYIPYI